MVGVQGTSKILRFFQLLLINFKKGCVNLIGYNAAKFGVRGLTQTAG